MARLGQPVLLLLKPSLSERPKRCYVQRRGPGSLRAPVLISLAIGFDVGSLYTMQLWDFTDMALSGLAFAHNFGLASSEAGATTTGDWQAEEILNRGEDYRIA